MAESEVELTMTGLDDESTQLSMTEDVDPADENTQDSSNGESSRKSKSFGSRPLPADVVHVEMHPSEIIEYEWPHKSGKKYFVQEQIAQLLGVTSFKRKYPDLNRRPMEHEERKYVMEELQLKMPQHLANNMTVLDANEVHQLMASQYAEIYTEYTKCVAARIKNEMLEKQRKLEALANNKEKLAEMREEALKAVAEFNKDLNSSIKVKSFYDHHTQIVFEPMNKFKKLKPKYTRPVPYPVALIEGQYTNYYKKYTPEELRELPVYTVLENEKIFPIVRRAPSPPSALVSDQELQRKIDEEKAKEKRNLHRQGSTNVLHEQSIGSPSSTQAKIIAQLNARRQSNVNAQCGVCTGGIDNEKPILLQCNSCLSHFHPNCLDMNPNMIQVVRTYQWTCIDCKRCTVCMKPDNEDAMMCCDNCDRGYHTFCVGMSSPPTGTWICTKFCGKAQGTK